MIYNYFMDQVVFNLLKLQRLLFSVELKIWEDFVQVMLRALWRERFEIGSNLPTIILATECLLGFPAKFFPFHQDHKTRFEFSRSKLLQLWKQGMIENKLFFWISFLVRFLKPGAQITYSVMVQLFLSLFTSKNENDKQPTRACGPWSHPSEPLWSLFVSA